jgi:hypothetical protein
LFKLQSLGITEDEVLNVCKFFEEYGRGMASGSKQVQNMNQFQADGYLEAFAKRHDIFL